VYGLAEGEGQIVASIINTELTKYRNSGGNFAAANGAYTKMA